MNDETLTAFQQINESDPRDIEWMWEYFSDDGKFALYSLISLADEQDETKPCTCGQPDCPFAETGPVQVGIVGGDVMEFGKQRGVTQIPF